MNWFSQFFIAYLVVNCVHISWSKRVIAVGRSTHSSSVVSTTRGELRVLTLNVQGYGEMCWAATPSQVLNREGEPIGTCSARLAEDLNCNDDDTARHCCAYKVVHANGSSLKPCTRRGENREPCEDKEWRHYGEAPAGEGADMLCIQGGKAQMKKLILDSGADVVATQEDWEFKPLRVEGYISIISPPSDEQHRKVNGEKLPLLDVNGRQNHLVNTLLVRKELFNGSATRKLCDEEMILANGPSDPDLWRCGVKLSSQKGRRIRNQIEKREFAFNSSTHPLFEIHKWMAVPRVAALAALSVGEGNVLVVSSLHLSGGRFDDNLVGAAEGWSAEKKRQMTKLRKHIDDTGLPGIVIGDFNGPDDFQKQWHHALNAPFDFAHTRIKELFGKEGLDKIRENGVVELKDLSKYLAKPFGFLDLNAYYKEYYMWMQGVHDLMKRNSWYPLFTSKHFTSKYENFPKLATTSKFGGVVDYIYVSPGVLMGRAQVEPPVEEVQSDENETMDSISVAVSMPSIYSQYEVKGLLNVNWVLTDHVPVHVTLKRVGLPSM